MGGLLASMRAAFQESNRQTFSTMNYYDNPEIIIIKASERNMAQPIITLYDKLLKDDNTTPHPLLNLLIQTKSANALPIPTNRKVYCNQEHWAQMSSDFPLSISQRETLAMYTTPECADILSSTVLREQEKPLFCKLSSQTDLLIIF